MTDKPVLRLGFIGLGQAVNRIFEQYADVFSLPYKITAAADTRQQALGRFRQQFGGETYTTAEELCSSLNVDVVYVATPPELHRQHVTLAAQNGKHVICEKPLALSLEDCEAMNAVADRCGVKLMAGHTHSFDAPIRKMREIVKSGQLGPLVSINTWNLNEFNPRPWPTQELQSTHGPILNQGPHQVDIVRQLGGGVVRSVRARTFWDPLRQCEGGYLCFLEFEDGVPATLVYDARGFFDTSELFWWVGEGGDRRAPETNLKMRRNFRKLSQSSEAELERALEAQKEQGRYGAENITPEVWELWGYGAKTDEKHQPFFGLTIASCEKGAMRQSADGLLIYGEQEHTEIPVAKTIRGRVAELMELYQAIVDDRPVFHDGRWGAATLEVCLAILESSRQRKEILLTQQVAIQD
jgi:predicted dehydrogenase